MKTVVALLLCLLIGPFAAIAAQEAMKRDVLKTSAGDLELNFIGHASLMLRFRGMIIHIDPYGTMSDYITLPKAEEKPDQPAERQPEERAREDGQRDEERELRLPEAELLADGDADDGEDHPHGEHHREPEGVHRQDAVPLPGPRARHEGSSQQGISALRRE